MRRAEVFVHDRRAGIIEEIERSLRYRFIYDEGYDGPSVSLAMPADRLEYFFDCFPPFFDGLLPEGVRLDALLRLRKLDRNDLFGQLMAVGNDLVGAVTVRELP